MSTAKSKALREIWLQLVRLVRVLGLATLIILAAVVIAQMAEGYWNGRFDRACSGQYPKYQVVDACQRTAKCVLNADELKLKSDFDEQCTVDLSYDKVHDTYTPVIKAVPRAPSTSSK